MLQVLKLFLASRNASLKEVHFPAELGPSYVYASPEAINEMVDQFLGIEASGGATANQEGVEENEQDRAARKARKKARHKEKKEKKEPIVKPKPPGSDELVPAREAGEMEAEIVARRVNGHFPVYFPTRLPSGAYYVESDPTEKVIDPFVYGIKDEDGDRHEAYRMVVVLEKNRRHPLLRRTGDSWLVGPADPQQPERNQDDQRARVRNLRRQRPDQTDLLAPGREQLLGLE